MVRRQSRPERLSFSHFEIGMKTKNLLTKGKRAPTSSNEVHPSEHSLEPRYPSVAHILVHIAKALPCKYAPGSLHPGAVFYQWQTGVRVGG